jgi:hypothetical protein
MLETYIALGLIAEAEKANFARLILDIIIESIWQDIDNGTLAPYYRDVWLLSP